MGPKWKIFYWEKAFHAGKKISKNNFAPSEKFSCYALHLTTPNIEEWGRGEVYRFAKGFLILLTPKSAFQTLKINMMVFLKTGLVCAAGPTGLWNAFLLQLVIRKFDLFIAYF